MLCNINNSNNKQKGRRKPNISFIKNKDIKSFIKSKDIKTSTDRKLTRRNFNIHGLKIKHKTQSQKKTIALFWLFHFCFFYFDCENRILLVVVLICSLILLLLHSLSLCWLRFLKKKLNMDLERARKQGRLVFGY